MFIPRVKYENLNEEKKLSKTVYVFVADNTASGISRVLQEFIPYLTFKETDIESKATFIFRTVPGISQKEEYYEIESDADALKILAKDKRGHINAAATISQMIWYENNSFYLSLGKIQDYPDKAFRSFMIDTGRKYIPIHEFKAEILIMARSKMTKLHIHLSDAEGYSVEFDSYPELPSPDKKNHKKYSKDEIREIVAYASLFGIDVIPEIDMPAHSFNLTTSYPELLCRTKEKANGWVMCISNEQSYDYIKAVLSEVAELFPYEYIHVGTDEIDMRDVFNPRFEKHQFLDWNECELCRKNFKKLGYNSVTDRFYYFIRRVYDIVTSLGKKMIMWNDNIDISKKPELPRDILIEFWRIAAPMRGPRENCSMKRFLEESFKVINAHFPYAYIGDTNKDNLIAFDVTKEYNDFPENEGLEHAVIGAEACAWDDRYYLSYAIYSFIPIFADRCYNTKAPIIYGEDFERSLTKFTLGVGVPEGLNIYKDYLKDLILNEKMPETIFKPEAKLSDLYSILSKLTKQLPNEKLLAKAYIKELRRHIG